MNYAEKNKALLASNTDTGRTWKEAIQSIKSLDHYTRKQLYCVRCGNHTLTYPILLFFDFDPEKLMCYRCQEVTREK